jgi:hypothetical protein
MVQPVNLLAVAAAVPPHGLEQTAVTAAARHAYARTFARYPKLADVFEAPNSTAPFARRRAVLDWAKRSSASRWMTRNAPSPMRSLEREQICGVLNHEPKPSTLANGGSNR